MKTGRFIVLEGIEAAGKTTNLECIRAQVAARGCEVLITREPGGTELGERIRQLLLDPALAPVKLAELLLIFAARSQHIAQVIEPALRAGKWVLSDRFTDASFAYQGGGRGFAQHTIASLEQIVQGALRPDLVFVLDLEPRVAMQRLAARGAALDRFEREPEDFFARVQNVYHRRAAECPQRYRIIDANRPLAEVQAALGKVLEPLLENWCLDGISN